MLAIVTRAGASSRDRSRGAVSNKAALCALLGGIGACGFPSYGYQGTAPAAGASGVRAGGGMTAIAGGGSGGMIAGAAGTGAGGSGGVAGMGVGGTPAGMAGGGGSGGSEFTCMIAHGGSAGAAPAGHCSNGSKDSDETGADCGGPSCSPCKHTEACRDNTDCMSALCTAAKTCAPLFELDLETIVDTRATRTLQFLLRLKYQHPVDKLPLKDVALRYYFARGDAAEPIVPFGTQAVYNDMSIDGEARWTIQRVLVDPKTLTDSYLEITFPTSKKTLLQGDVIDVTQSVQAGNAPSHQFDQLTHYSFRSTTDLSISERVTAYAAGRLVWGTPPSFSVPEQCFATAVNFGGDSFTGNGQHYLAGSDPSVQFTGETVHATLMPYPTPDAAFLPLVQSGVLLDTAHAVLRVPNGPYWVYPYLISADAVNQGDLTLQGEDVATFGAGTVNGLAGWARLGPFRVTVKDGGLDFGSAGGAVRVAGAELYQVAQ